MAQIYSQSNREIASISRTELLIGALDPCSQEDRLRGEFGVRGLGNIESMYQNHRGTVSGELEALYRM